MNCFKPGSSRSSTPVLLYRIDFDRCLWLHLNFSEQNRSLLCCYCLTEFPSALNRKYWLYVAAVISCNILFQILVYTLNAISCDAKKNQYHSNKKFKMGNV